MTAITPHQPAFLLTTSSGSTLDISVLAGRVRPSTAQMYRRDFAAYLAFAGTASAAMDPSVFAQWRAVLAQSGKSPNTVNRMLSAVRAVMSAAADAGYVEASLADAFRAKRGVTVGALRENLKPDARTPITKEQLRIVLSLPDMGTLSGMMHRALLITLATSGLRIGEAVSLRQSQLQAITVSSGTGYRITGVLGKSAEEPRVAPLSPAAHDAIQTWLSARPIDSAYIFTGFSGRGGSRATAKPISERSGWYIVKRYFSQAGLDSVTPHDLRRYVGTQLARKDIRMAQKALGHKSIDTTARHYVLDELPVGLTDDLV